MTRTASGESRSRAARRGTCRPGRGSTRPPPDDTGTPPGGEALRRPHHRPRAPPTRYLDMSAHVGLEKLALDRGVERGHQCRVDSPDVRPAHPTDRVQT